MAAEPEQVPGLNLSTTPAVPAAVPPQVATTDFGMVNLPGYTAEQRAETLAPSPTFDERMARLGTTLEAFGAGYRGQEPLFLKLRRQQAVEEQQRTDRKLKVQQFELEQQKRSDAVFQQGVAIAMDDGKPIETRIAALEGMSRQNPGIAALKPLITKQVLQDLPMAKDYLSPEVMQAIEGIQRNPNGKVDFPGGLTGIAAEIKSSADFGRAKIVEKGENLRESRLHARLDKGESLDREDKRFLSNREKSRLKEDMEFDTLVLQKRKLAADTTVAEATTGARIGEANRPKTLEAQMGNQVVTLQETAPGSGKWETLTVGGKAVTGEKKPLVQVDTSEKSSEMAAKQYMKGAQETYQQLKTAPIQLKNMAAAKELVAQSRGFMGTGGETLLSIAKFMNNRLGFHLDQKGIVSAEELQGRIFQNVMENLKKLDAQPSQLQQTIMMDALGKLGTDPNALPNMLDAYSSIIRDKVDTYNAEVTSAEKRGTRFPYDPVIKLPPVDYSPKLDFKPPKSWDSMADKQRFEWLTREKRLSKHEATKYIAEH